MGVYIKGMEMPTEYPLWIVISPDGTVQFNRVAEWETAAEKAVPVPRHGRLGDLDELKVKIKKEDNGYSWDSYGDGMYDAFQSVYQCIDAAPTIIPAEEE